MCSATRSRPCPSAPSSGCAASATLVRLLPRLGLAAAAAAAVLILTFVVRSSLRRYERARGVDVRTPGVVTAGALIAATLAAPAILGASRLAGALFTFALFYAAAAGLHVLGGRTFVVPWWRRPPSS